MQTMKRRSNELPDINTPADPSLSNEIVGPYFPQDSHMKAEDSIESIRRPKDTQHQSSDV